MAHLVQSRTVDRAIPLARRGVLRGDVVRAPLDTTAEVETPEHVRFRYQVVGPGRRALAWLIDLVARGAIAFAFFVVAMIAWAGSTDGLRNTSTGIVLLVLFVLEWGYYVFFET